MSVYKRILISQASHLKNGTFVVSQTRLECNNHNGKIKFN